MAGYLGWLGAFRSQQDSEISLLVSRNDNNSMPLWTSEDAVVNLREKDYKTFMQRRKGGYMCMKTDSSTLEMSKATTLMACWWVRKTASRWRNSDPHHNQYNHKN